MVVVAYLWMIVLKLVPITIIILDSMKVWLLIRTRASPKIVTPANYAFLFMVLERSSPT